MFNASDIIRSETTSFIHAFESLINNPKKISNVFKIQSNKFVYAEKCST